ncbi:MULTISPECIES: hypothetical protein [unclassified Enterococcus]|uniref:hypothetical protein n=1 Tax=unclassified Enterococcus TaxID=2608891 RepID=UPI0015582DC2|nr:MULTISPECIES: hypothetical protein [unclassified Enterococcus]MBS7576781.1 hypothetical protein [Enterococcus sp. MMGLQ5-2]MBS7583732.1 hypothetical protein [Enterococcus sp. MMGLQ5-1]NPD11593.1 hypothetical protein [Enterococcus sp. MMGLQ5-1]NPD36618.1 hypothetical protein [Enterococcus sp. MMGLQ5-2]
MVEEEFKTKKTPRTKDKIFQSFLFISMGLMLNIYAYPKSREFIKSVSGQKVKDSAIIVSLIFFILGIILFGIIFQIYIMKKIKNINLLLLIMTLVVSICGVIYSGYDEIVEVIMSNLAISSSLAYILYIIKEVSIVLYNDITEINKTDPIKKYGILIPIITFIIGLLIK